jgi:positive regulator of sigma E activity
MSLKQKINSGSFWLGILVAVLIIIVLGAIGVLLFKLYKRREASQQSIVLSNVIQPSTPQLN